MKFSKYIVGLLYISIVGLFEISRAEESYQEPLITEQDRSHWAFQPLPGFSENSIDSLLLAKLDSIGLSGFAPRATGSILLRRLCFTLTGLPPTEKEITEFDSHKLESFVDKFLASPAYGEHWAQHWLDLARFAETDGFEHDKTRAQAWKYRDWVIDSFNHDLPYDQFVAHQIAGDELAPGTDAVLGTGFLYAGPDMPDINLPEERRHTVLNDITSTVGTVFLGLTIGCAQCHDHKDDPFSQADFYRLRAFFDNAQLPSKNKSLLHYFKEWGPSITHESVLRPRGDFTREGQTLRPDFIRAINLTDFRPDISPTRHSSGRRSALARWITNHRQNPLLARVIVNRIWQQHFGKGLVSTPNDFGILGAKPSHPELLDQLATRFVESGWSLKHLHRSIILTDAWQQSSQPSSIDDIEWTRRKALDPDNRFLSRRQPIRLSGEVVRDSMLGATNELNHKQGGPGFLPPLPKEVTVTLLKNQWPITEEESEHHRRSIYLFARRNLRYPLFELFDRPDANQPCGKRHVSTTAPQSLFLLNSQFSEERAIAFARLIRRHESAIENQVRLAYLRTVSRQPDSIEIRTAQEFISNNSLEMFCLALFNQNEFIFID